MKIPGLLALPPAILFLCAFSTTAESQWPHNLPRHMKYFPEDEVHVKRSLDIQEKLRREKPIGVKKMSSDEGEMFMFDNWIFASDGESAERRKRSESEGRALANVTRQYEAALRPIEESLRQDWLLRFRARDALLKRDFKCPSGTSDCSSIGQPNSCCGTGSTCIEISDQGFGPVGCCPEGESCNGGISCDSDAGYSSCPESPNGGCCLPGYSCLGVGCVAISTSITYIQPSTSTSETSTSSSSGVVVVPTTDSSSASSTSSASPTPTPTPSTSSSYTCSTGWFSCAASLGGGCCQTGRTCASGASCLGDEPSSTMAPSAPVRPTSAPGTTSAPPASSSPTDEVCPTGFYVCSAYYPSGCCRVGRDCQTTGSCVPTASTTVVNTNGVVVVAPTGASLAPQGGSCPSAWFSCAANQGGNCCPNGFSCGENQCTAASGTSVTDKAEPTGAATIPSTISISVMIASAFGIGIAMVML